jgi:hypothetical protein
MVLRTKIVRQGCMEEQVWPLVKNVISTPKQLSWNKRTPSIRASCRTCDAFSVVYYDIQFGTRVER